MKRSPTRRVGARPLCSLVLTKSSCGCGTSLMRFSGPSATGRRQCLGPIW